MTQLCKRLGAQVIGTCSSDSKAHIAKANGCDHVINYQTQDFAQQARAITQQRGVDVIYDGIGKTTFLPGFDALTKRATMVLFGNACGEHPDPIEPTMLAQKGSVTLVRPALYDYLLDQSEMQSRARDLFDYILDGSVSMPISETLALADAAKAHSKLEARQVTGKILLTC